MTHIGIDLGSRFVKVAVRQDDAVSFRAVDTIQFYKNHVKRSEAGLTIDLSFLDGITPGTAPITATGYGRNLMEFANATIISEIKAHFRGALSQTEEQTFTLVDIGGQDSKVIFVRDGYIEDFVMNDKCAASTGRFLENAANLLGISLEELATMSEDPVPVSSTCAIFSESEIIGLIAQGTPVPNIGAGIHESIAKRLIPLVKKYKTEHIFASGGAAKNAALLAALSRLAGKEILPLPETQFNGCLGCLATMQR